MRKTKDTRLPAQPDPKLPKDPRPGQVIREVPHKG